MLVLSALKVWCAFDLHASDQQFWSTFETESILRFACCRNALLEHEFDSGGSGIDELSIWIVLNREMMSKEVLLVNKLPPIQVK